MVLAIRLVQFSSIFPLIYRMNLNDLATWAWRPDVSSVCHGGQTRESLVDQIDQMEGTLRWKDSFFGVYSIYIYIHHHTSNIIDNRRPVQTCCKYIDGSQLVI